MAQERIILGIDPGTTIMGFGLIKVVGKRMEFLQLNELKLTKYSDHYVKLRLIFERTIELIETHHPDEIAIEAPFFGKNVQSMLKLGRAQGVAMAAGLSRQVPITEYSPKKLKWPLRVTEMPPKNRWPRCCNRRLTSRSCPRTWIVQTGLRLPFAIFITLVNQREEKVTVAGQPLSNKMKSASNSVWQGFIFISHFVNKRVIIVTFIFQPSLNLDLQLSRPCNKS